MFGYAFTDGRWNYDFGYALTGGPIDPFDPDYTGIVEKGPLQRQPRDALKQQSIYAQDRITLHRPALRRRRPSLRLDRDRRGFLGTAIRRSRSTTTSSRPASRVLYAMDNGVSPYVSYSESFYQEAFGTDARRQRLRADPRQAVRGRGEVPAARHDLALHRGGLRHHQVEQTVADPIDPNFQIQNGEATARGVELGAQAEWRGFSIDAAYTYLDTESDERRTASPACPRTRPRPGSSTPSTAARRVRGRLRRRATSARPSTAGVVTPDVTLYDAMLAYEWSEYRVALTGRNLARQDLPGELQPLGVLLRRVRAPSASP